MKSFTQFHQQQLNENAGFVAFAEYLQTLVADGTLTQIQAISIYTIAYTSPVLLVIGASITWKEIARKIKQFFKDWKDKKNMTPETIAEFAKMAEDALDEIEFKGKKNHLKSLIRKYKESSDKDSILNAQKEIEKYLKKNTQKLDEEYQEELEEGVLRDIKIAIDMALEKFVSGGKGELSKLSADPDFQKIANEMKMQTELSTSTFMKAQKYIMDKYHVREKTKLQDIVDRIHYALRHEGI